MKHYEGSFQMKKNSYTEKHTFKKLKDIIMSFTKIGSYGNITNTHIFRGESDVKYLLKPSIQRIKDYNNEKSNSKEYEEKFAEFLYEIDILRQFFDLSDKSGLKIPKNDFLRKKIHSLNTNFSSHDFENMMQRSDFLEIMGLARHYGLNTRLLDWSYDYKVALYFAVRKLDKFDKDGRMWALNYDFFENHPYKIDQENYSISISENESLKSFSIPLHFYRPEYHMNSNLRAQKGLFSLWNKISDENSISDKISLDKKIKKQIELSEGMEDYLKDNNIKLIYEFIISKDLKIEILEELYKEGYSEEYLFPGYEGVASAINNNLELKKYKKKNMKN